MEKPKKGASDEAQDAAFDVRVRKLCARLEVPFDIPELSRWARIGVKLALNKPEFQPELKTNKKSGRPKGGQYPQDQKILDAIEDVMASQQLDFEDVLPPAIKHLLRRNKLRLHVDRTTHRRRLRRLYKDRVRNRPVMMASILKGERDK